MSDECKELIETIAGDLWAIAELGPDNPDALWRDQDTDTQAKYRQLATWAHMWVRLEGGVCWWQDISTAPKDGTEVLAVSRHGQYSITRWLASSWLARADGEYAQLPSPYVCGDGDYVAVFPVKWMPLPPPPKGA